MSRVRGSRERFLAATAQLLRRQGYHASGLSQIVRESGAPKGSLYFLFPEGKEALAREALEVSGEAMRASIASWIENAASPVDAIVTVCESLAAQLEESRFEAGCPLATVVLEAALRSEPLRMVCASAYAEWETVIARRLLDAGLSEVRAKTLATAILAAIEGALLLARAHRDASALRSVGDELGRLVQEALR